MQIKKETNRFYYIDIDEEIDVDVDGIESDGTVLRFPKIAQRNEELNRLQFKSIEQCEAWINQLKANKMKFVPMQKVAKDIPHVSQKAIAITDGMWDKMQKYMVTPGEFDKDDFVVFEAQLANTAPDRDKERFSKKFLQSLMKTIVGKSKLTGHQHGTIGEGVFFDSSIEKHSVDDFIATLENVPDKTYLSKLSNISDKEGGIFWGVVKYYMHKEIHADKITRIKTGEAAPMSIGFRAPKSPTEIKNEKGDETLYWEWDNAETFEAEAVEASDVYLGAQYGARNRKDYRADDSEHGDAKSGEKENGEIEQKPNEVKMELKINGLDHKTEIDIPVEYEQAVKDAFAKFDEEVKELTEEVEQKNTELVEANKSLNEVKEAVGEYTIESLKDAKEKSGLYAKLREDLEMFILKSMHILGQIKFEEKEAKLAELKAKTIDELFELRKTLTSDMSKMKNFNVAQLSPDYKETQKQSVDIINESPYTLD